MNLEVDTGASQTWINGPDCKSCHGEAYEKDPTTRNMDSTQKIINDKVKVSGFESSEDFFFQEENIAAENIEMILASHFQGPKEFKADGVIGLSGDRSFVSQLFRKNLIKKNMFAMNFSDLGNKLFIGDYPKSFLQNNFKEFSASKTDEDFESNMTWVNVN